MLLMVGSLGFHPYYVMQYLVSFLVLQSSHRKIEGWFMWLLYSNCGFAVDEICLFLACSAIGWSGVCNCGISWSY